MFKLMLLVSSILLEFLVNFTAWGVVPNYLSFEYLCGVSKRLYELEN